MTNHSVVSFYAKFGLIFKVSEDKATNGIENWSLSPTSLSGVTIRMKCPEANIFRRPNPHKECQSYSYLSHLGTQATELTEAKESAYVHVRFSTHSDSGIT